MQTLGILVEFLAVFRIWIFSGVHCRVTDRSCSFMSGYFDTKTPGRVWHGFPLLCIWYFVRVFSNFYSLWLQSCSKCQHNSSCVGTKKIQYNATSTIKQGWKWHSPLSPSWLKSCFNFIFNLFQVPVVTISIRKMNSFGCVNRGGK